jgi:hypothetical protein
MSAKRLGRVVGLVFVLAAILSGATATAAQAAESATSQAVEVSTLTIDWS